MNQTPTASIDLAQLDKPTLEQTVEMMLAAGFDESNCRLAYAGHGLTLKLEHLQDFAHAARRSLTSGAPAGRVIDSDPGCGQSLIDVALEPGTAIYRAPVHGAAAPSAETARLLADLAAFTGAGGMAAVNELAGRAKALMSAGAAAKTDHAPAGVGAWVNDPPEVFPWDKEDRAAAVKFYQDNPGAALFDFEQRIRDRKEKVEQASAAGAGSDQAPVCEHCGRAPGERRDECENCPASITVQDERALREAVRAVVQLVQNGEWADLLHTDPDAVALWDAVDGLLRRAAHPVQDGEKDAKGGAA